MAHRVFRDDAGAEWQAWDVRPSTAAPGAVARIYEAGWLCFERAAPAGRAGRERRRLAPAPAGWAAASDEGLRALLARAPLAPPARRATPERGAPSV